LWKDMDLRGCKTPEAPGRLQRHLGGAPRIVAESEEEPAPQTQIFETTKVFTSGAKHLYRCARLMMMGLSARS